MNHLELQKKLDAERTVLHKVFTEAGDTMDMSKVTSISGSAKEKIAKIREMNDTLTKLGKEYDEAKSLHDAKESVAKAEEEAKKKNRRPHPEPNEGKEQPKRMSFGEGFIKAGGNLKGNRHKEVALPEGVNMKTLFETTAGWAPESTRTGRVVEDAQRPIQVMDLIPQGSTGQNAIVYMEETTFTNPAAETAEGGSYPEATLELTEQTENVRKIPVFIPVTDEQLEDVPQVQGYLNRRLQFMLMQRLDQQFLTGDGVAPNMTGILNKAGIQTQALGGDTVTDAFYKAITLVRATGQAFPNACVIHPNDWQDVRLLKDANGNYIWGHPSESGPERLWGLTVAVAQAITENTGLVGDFNFCEFAERQGIMVKVSDSHSDFFIKGKQAVRAELRGAFVIYRAAAFCSVTGI